MSHKQHPIADFEQDPLSSRLQTSTPPCPAGHTHRSEHTKDEAGVCEAYPGIIEFSDIDPLHHERMKEEKDKSFPSSAASRASGAAKYVYSAAIGDDAGKRAGKEALLGSSK